MVTSKSISINNDYGQKRGFEAAGYLSAPLLRRHVPCIAHTHRKVRQTENNPEKAKGGG